MKSVKSKSILEPYYRSLILGIFFAVAFFLRLFSVIRFESIIHEFDPWFNYRATKKLVADGFYEFWNWFDDRSWYPLGRVVGGTVYPGLMSTAAIIHKVLLLLNFPVDIRNICVFMAPAFSVLTSYSVYLLTSELHSKTAGLFAAGFMAMAPGYISRSVAGSYDNEAISIFLLMFCFYLWIKAIKLGSAFFGAATALVYFYMVSAWGGYVFITNLIPLHVLALLLMQRYSPRVYVAYTSWYTLGTLLSLQIPFVSFLPVKSSEHMAAMGVFGLLQVVAFTKWFRTLVTPSQFRTVVWSLTSLLMAGVVLLAFTLKNSGVIVPWAGRFYSLWDTSYAKKHIPIISSVSEHQPTPWSSFFFDLHLLTFLLPVGIWLCFRSLRDEHVFVLLYSLCGSYFAGVMVRLMLTLTPIACVAGGMAMAALFYTPTSTSSEEETKVEESSAPASPKNVLSKSSTKKVAKDVRYMTAFVFSVLLAYFVWHCTYITSVAYSSPSVVLSTQDREGNQHIIDDFREAYYWLRKNTHPEAKVMSWWDYGYQLAGFANRTTYVDNNTWNNTHIATVGRIMASNEKEAYPLLRKLKVDYLLVIFGGVLGYSGDDINKFLWMVRIAQGVFPDQIQEPNYFTDRGEYRVDDDAPLTMRQSLMYKMSYYKFLDLFGGSRATDRVRGSPISSKPIVFSTLEEAFTSENWIVRLYRVKDPDFLHRSLFDAKIFEDGKPRRIKRTNVVEY